MKGLHPVALEEEVAVDVEVAAVVAGDLGAERLHDLLVVQVAADPAELGVAQVAAVLALAADVVDVLPGALVGAEERVVAVDGCRDAGPDAFAVVTALDERLAAGERVVHGLAFAFVEHGRPSALAARHGSVVLVLGQAVGQAVADEDGLEVDVRLLVAEDLRAEDWDVVSGVRFAGDVEVLMRVLWELLEEEGEEGIDVLAGGYGVADAAATVGVADVDGLI